MSNAPLFPAEAAFYAGKRGGSLCDLAGSRLSGCQFPGLWSDEVMHSYSTPGLPDRGRAFCTSSGSRRPEYITLWKDFGAHLF